MVLSWINRFAATGTVDNTSACMHEAVFVLGFLTVDICFQQDLAKIALLSKSVHSQARQVANMSKSPCKHVCFVYGTLKRGQPNHKHMIDEQTGKAEFVSCGHTVNKYPLVISGKYNIPFLIYAEGKGNIVQGEVYRADDKKRDFLDDFESHPDFYERMLTDIVLTDEGTPSAGEESQTKMLKCWVYFLKNYKPEMLELQAYASYNSFGPHGLRYVESEEASNLDEA